jgi:ABC-2 type transport system permease protein
MKGFILKEFYHIFRDVRSLIVLFGMPVIQILLFGFAISTELKNAPVAFLDHSNDYVTQQITNKILSSGFFVNKAVLHSEKDIEPAFRKGEIKEVVVFGQNFAKNLEKNREAGIQLLVDASDPNTANIVSNYTQAIIADYQQEYYGNAAIPVQISAESRMLYNPSLRSVYMFVPGIITMLLMLISAMMTSISIAREKELGTMEVLLVSPLHPFQIVVGKVVPYLLLSFINAVTILVMGYFIFKVPFEGNLILLLAESMLFLLLALSLGIFISTVSKNQQVAMMMSMFALMLPTILLSGFIFPIENMPDALQYFSLIMPPRWFNTIVKAIMLKGLGLEYIWKETLILFGMTVLFIVLSIKKFKIRLE